MCCPSCPFRMGWLSCQTCFTANSSPCLSRSNGLFSRTAHSLYCQCWRRYNLGSIPRKLEESIVTSPRWFLCWAPETQSPHWPGQACNTSKTGHTWTGYGSEHTMPHPRMQAGLSPVAPDLHVVNPFTVGWDETSEEMIVSKLPVRLSVLCSVLLGLGLCKPLLSFARWIPGWSCQQGSVLPAYWVPVRVPGRDSPSQWIATCSLVFIGPALSCHLRDTSTTLGVGVPP